VGSNRIGQTAEHVRDFSRLPIQVGLDLAARRQFGPQVGSVSLHDIVGSVRE